MTEAKAWEIVYAIRDYVEASHTTSARPRQPFLAAMVKALVAAADYQPPTATPVANVNELLARVDVPEPAPRPPACPGHADGAPCPAEPAPPPPACGARQTPDGWLCGAPAGQPHSGPFGVPWGPQTEPPPVPTIPEELPRDIYCKAGCGKLRYFCTHGVCIDHHPPGPCRPEPESTEPAPSRYRHILQRRPDDFAELPGQVVCVRCGAVAPPTLEGCPGPTQRQNAEPGRSPPEPAPWKPAQPWPLKGPKSG